MKTILSRDHRKIHETTVAQARVHAEVGAAKALQALAVGAKEAPVRASEPQKKFRVHLRAHGPALGDLLRPDDRQTNDHLVTEIAYEHWHRMLFACFLAASDLLMHQDGYPVSLADCKEDAESFDPPPPAANGKSPATTRRACCPTSSAPTAPLWRCICRWKPSRRSKPCSPSYLPGWDMPKRKPEIFTDHFGLVSDILSECFTQLRNKSRLAVPQHRVFFGGALRAPLRATPCASPAAQQDQPITRSSYLHNLTHTTLELRTREA